MYRISNKYHFNILHHVKVLKKYIWSLRDAILVGFGNAATSLYSGFVIFSVLGYMAYIKDVDLEVVTAKGDVLVHSFRWRI